jgi:hypothetical protein
MYTSAFGVAAGHTHDKRQNPAERISSCLILPTAEGRTAPRDFRATTPILSGERETRDARKGSIFGDTPLCFPPTAALVAPACCRTLISGQVHLRETCFLLLRTLGIVDYLVLTPPKPMLRLKEENWKWYGTSATMPSCNILNFACL